MTIRLPTTATALLALGLWLAPLPASGAAGKAGPQLPERKVEVLLEMKHPRGLNRFVRAVSDPRSRRYRRYATVERLIARYAAKPRTRKRLLDWLARRDLHGSLSATGTHIFVTMPRRLAARFASHGREASLSRSAQPRRALPAPLHGDVSRATLLRARPSAHGPTLPRSAAPTASASAAKTAKKPYTSILRHSGTAAGCPAGSSGGLGPPLEPVTPNQYLTAYGHAEMHAKGFKGQGQTIALVEIGGFRHSDIVTFDKCFGVKTPPIRVVPVKVKGPLKPEDETTLDLEMLTVGAPKVDRIMVYQGLGSLGGIAFTAGAALGAPGHRPDVISMSLGFCEPEISGDLVLRSYFDNVLALAAGAGISVLISSGDTGSSGCRTQNSEGETTAMPIPAVSMPASSPYATAVGGTNLKFTKANRIAEEIVWNDSPIQPAGGGGGASIISLRRPWWQAPVKRYGVGRIVPDIAALADIYPGYAFFCTAAPCAQPGQKVPGWGSIGGTSAAAPLMAAGVALANQYAAQRGQPPLGFLNPLLYRLGADSKRRAAAFNDVTKGNNDLGRLLSPEAGGGSPLGCCSARVGYDWASGWGSLKVPAFAAAAAQAAAGQQLDIVHRGN